MNFLVGSLSPSSLRVESVQFFSSSVHPFIRFTITEKTDDRITGHSRRANWMGLTRRKIQARETVSLASTLSDAVSRLTIGATFVPYSSIECMIFACGIVPTLN